MANKPMKDRTGILVILDGFGVNPNPDHNAVYHAKMPTFKGLWESYPHTTLEASESFVGLPNGFMGNSEVGHLNIGAGRVVYQDFSLISKAIEEGSFFKNETFLKLVENIHAKKGAALHLMGLVSDGGVHSHISHLYALLRLAKEHAIENVWIHAFTDGRDTHPTSGLEFISKTQEFFKDAHLGKLATLSGRFFAMDRDKRWERTAEAYEAIVMGKASATFKDPAEYIRRCYEGEHTDEFLPPAVSEKYKGINDGDGVIFFNFRADRARQLTRAFYATDFKEFARERFPVLAGFVSMTPYDESLPVPAAYEKAKVKQTLGEVISSKGGKQLRIAETEKYAHVTYFFNGGDENVFPGEKRILVPSPREVRTYDLKPAMSATEVTEKLLEELKKESYQLVVVNFANPDMVGHTGNFQAAISALETVDHCLKKIVDWVEREGAFMVLTADHGNCEMMEDGEGRVLTSHTLLPVPFVILDAKRGPEKPALKLASSGRLCDVAPTLLQLWGISQPKEMTGRSLIL